ncbi:MAG: hypothetical protein ACI9OJ_003164, partial [Myxococcota bacterium]
MSWELEGAEHAPAGAETTTTPSNATAGRTGGVAGMGYDAGAAALSPANHVDAGPPAPPAATTQSDTGLGLLNKARITRAIDYNNARPDAVALVPQLERTLQVPRGERTGTTFGEALVQRIARIQQDRNSGVDGKIGPGTLGVLQTHFLTGTAAGAAAGTQTDASGLWPADGSTLVQRFDHYAGICALFGHTIAQGSGTLLGIRGVMLYAQRTHAVEHVRAYDDTYVLLSLDAKGQKSVREFSGATHAYQATSSASPDVNSGGGGDVATARENDGAHMYNITNKSDFHGRTSMHITADQNDWTDEDVSGASWEPGQVPVWRDTNHDRDLSDTERTASEERSTTSRGGQNTSRQVLNGVGDYGTGVYFHPGFTQSKADGPGNFSSIACNTARMGDVDAISDSARANDGVNYLLIAATDVVARQATATQTDE